MICVTFMVILTVSKCWCAEPTLARLSFWIPPEQMIEFEAAYEKQVVPILKRHDIVASTEHKRTTVDSVFTRAFAFKTPVEFMDLQRAFQSDPSYRKVLRTLGATFGTANINGLIRYAFSIYRTPTGPGQQIAAGLGQGHWTTYGVPEGLAHSYVYSMLQDQDGTLWFGTRGGVSRYDGQTFTNFTTKDGLPHDHITSIILEQGGTLWFGTGGGVSRYDGQTFTNFTMKDGLPHDHVTSVVQDRDGVFWFGTEGGTSRYDGQAFTNFTMKDGLPHDHVTSIIQDRDGVLWFGTQRGVSRYDGQTFTNFTMKDGLAHNYVTSIIQGQDDLLWFGTRNGGVSKYDGQTFTTFTAKDGLARNRLLSMLQDRDGMFWFGAAAGGAVTRFDGQTFTTFTTKDGLANDWVYSIFQDREGSLWFGTGGGGVSRYDGQTFTTFTTEDGLAHNRVRSVLQDRDDVLWFGTGGGGVSQYDGQTFTNFTTQNGLPHGYVQPIFQDREGALWSRVYGGGVIRYDGQTFIKFTTEDGLAPYRVRSIIQDREGALWFGTEGGGVSRYDGQTFTNFTTKDGLAYNDVRSIIQDRKGTLWFGTYGGGVSRCDGQTFVNFTTKDGLADNFVTLIVQDREGALWFGTEGGGVTCYRQPPPSPPPVFIDAVLADRRYEGVSEIEIPSSVELTTFEFHGASFKTRPEAMVYRYRLHGYENEWSNTHARRVEYENLPIGTYTFEVQAVDRDLVYSKEPATMMLTVHLPYERIGLISALSIAIVLIGWQSVRVIRRDRRLQEANEALSDGNRELFQVNRALQRDRAVERIRAQVQTMEKASDFDGVLTVLAEDLRAVGLNFDTCEIDVLDISDNASTDETTIAYFETRGFNYTTYMLDPEGTVTEESYQVQSPFPNVTREMIERFIEGEPWRAVIGEGNAIVEVPISSYGRLRLTASNRERFTDEETEVLRDFTIAIALGYARYMDFQELEDANREIQLQTERKSAFLASMSHELRTPMNAILGFTRMVLRRSSDVLPEQQKENLNKVTVAGNHLLEMINDLLDLSKIEAGGMEVEAKPFSVKKLIQSCCDLVEPLIEAGVALTYDVEDGADEACTDEDKLRHVIGNLLSNARKFTTEGEIAVRARRIHDQLAISVLDTGIGMPKEALETIFDEFQQVKGSDQKHKGTGLGLAITKQYTELLGGTVSVESDVGKGTVFTIQIPAIYQDA